MRCSGGSPARHLSCAGRRTPSAHPGCGTSPVVGTGESCRGAGFRLVLSWSALRDACGRVPKGHNTPGARSNLHSRRVSFKQCYRQCSGPGAGSQWGSLAWALPI